MYQVEVWDWGRQYWLGAGNVTGAGKNYAAHVQIPKKYLQCD